MTATTRVRTVSRWLTGLPRALSLRLGAGLLVGYAAAGGLLGIEIFAFLAVWPLGIALLVVTALGGGVLRRRARRSESVSC